MNCCGVREGHDDDDDDDVMIPISPQTYVISNSKERERKKFFVCLWSNRFPPQWAMAPSFTRSLYHTRRTTVSRTPLDEWSARRRELYLTTHNTHNRQTSTSQHTTLTTDRPLPHDTQQTSTSRHTTDLYLTTHNRPLPHNTQHSQQTDMPPARFEPAVAPSERPLSEALDRAAQSIAYCRLL